MIWGQPSPRIRELIRDGAHIVLNSSSREWLREVDQATLISLPPIAADPELASVVLRANRANLAYFASAMLQNPGAAVPPYLGPESVCMARELVRRGLDTSALDIYRVAQNMAWHRWTEIAFQLTSDPEELRELLDLPFRLVSQFIDGTLACTAAQMRVEAEYAGAAHDECLGHRELVELVLDGADVSNAHIEAQLGYRFDGTHTAAIIWTEKNDAAELLDHAAKVLSEAVRGTSCLSVAAGQSTRWIWITEMAEVDFEQIGKAVDAQVRIAIGSTAPGINGFARSHRDALATQRLAQRLRSPRRVAQFAELQLVALFTENATGAAEFIQNTLGDFVAASPTMHATLLTYINSGCNASRAAKTLHTHRNTLLHRLEAAQQLLPGPLEQNLVGIAIALTTLRWRGAEFDESECVVGE